MPTTTSKKAQDETSSEKEVKKEPRKRAVKKESADSAVMIEAETIAAAELAKGGSFIPAIGRRKTATASVRLIKNGKGVITVNGKKLEQYFSPYELREEVVSPLRAVGQEKTLDISAKTSGGGIRGQSQAIRLGIARALIELNPTFRVSLKKLGFLSRDSRKRERKKPGKKSARRSPQWSKR
jgi:small subunit ribosomal protein S9